MGKTFTFTDTIIHNIAYKKMMKAVENGARDIIEIGYVEGQVHANSNMDVADLARDLSYGTRKIPARPHLEEGILSKANEIIAATKEHYKNVMENGDFSGLKKIAVIAVGGVKEFVTGDYYKNNVPNKQETIDRKKSDKPLIDTAQMVNSVTYVINGEKGGDRIGGTVSPGDKGGNLKVPKPRKPKE